MIETEGIQPGGVIEFRLSQRVSGHDYDAVLIPAIETALEKHDTLRILCHFDEGFEAFDLDAAWDDARVGLRHWNVWQRAAIVTDVDWLKTAVRAAGFFVSCPVRGFDGGELEEARRWIRESLGTIHLEFDDETDVATIRLMGMLEPAAYEGVAAEIDGWMAHRERVRLLLDLSEFDGWQGLRALGEHLHLVRDHRHVMERVAVVGDEDWQKIAVRVIGRFVLRGEARYFDDEDFDDARRWLVGAG